VFLDRVQRNALIAAAELAAGDFLRGMELTGARPIELSVAKVADFDGETLRLAHRKGRPPGAYLFTEDGQEPWRRHMWARKVRAAIAAQSKQVREQEPKRQELPVEASAYSFRHARIGELLQIHGVDPLTVAAQPGTSLAMIERGPIFGSFPLRCARSWRTSRTRRRKAREFRIGLTGASWDGASLSARFSGPNGRQRVARGLPSHTLTQRAIKRPQAGAKKVAASPRRLKGSASVTAREVEPLIERVVTILEEARSQVVRSVNSVMVLAYWHVGREIVHFVQGGAKRAEYGEQTLEALSSRLQERVGRGYSVRNLRYFRSFYQAYADREPSIHDAPVEFGASLVPNLAPSLTDFSGKLSWTHYRTLLTVEDRRARTFYEIEAGREGRSVTYIERQIHTQLFMRLLKSRNKAGVMDLAKRGQTVERPIDLMKSPVVLDFLYLPDSEVLHESDLESAILSKLSQFLLELGKGFAFVARQKR
jgi:predicted nuclease of restriction endonuclease-like (RecB) superfamily